ncbi:helix-turn-helix transcriptional regulator [Paenibacillus sp. UNC451MF]|uniref:helix-turn-helix transcriptional regulator n=1 Tax=Paenibacillus sp. UNC451MF TaxID=1449063 RepID=UPI00048D6F13|nr:helix-turn-helix domain-containing protein [Paenibacillus sp. UNC451MF]
MRMSWYYRILLSYAPIFFLVISILIFAFFAALNESAKGQISLTDEAIATKVMQAVDNNLKAAERMLIKEMDVNEKITSFFQDDGSKTVYDYFLISRKMDDLSSMLPFSNSIYMYNEATGKVLTRNGLSSLDQFGDSEFLLDSYRKGSYSAGWTNPRYFKEFNHEAGGERVVSLYKYYPVTGDKQGAVVINIRVPSLVGFIKDLTRYDAGFIRLIAPNREPFDIVNTQQARELNEDTNTDLKRKASDYTGWYFISGGQSNKQLSLLSLFHEFWIFVGLAAVVAGIVWFTYVTHRNFKPIHTIAGRIQDYTKRKSGELARQPAKNELKFIEAAIDGLIEKSSQYEQLYHDDLPVRKRQCLAEWLEGSTMMSEMQWRKEMHKLQVPANFEKLTIAVMEIDRYLAFTGSYSPSDQYLLKFTVSHVLQEIAQSGNVVLWNEWLEPHQMAIVFYWKDQEGTHRDQAVESMKQLQDWISTNLEFSVSVGLGTEITDYTEATRSYEEARERLSLKPLFGTNSLMDKADVRCKREREAGVFSQMQLLSTLSKSFRQDDGQWQVHLDKLAFSLRTGLFSQADIQHMMDFLLYQFHKEWAEMPGEVQQLWIDDYLPQLEAVTAKSLTLDEWHVQVRTLLSELEGRIREVRSVRSNHLLMSRVKHYIDVHYADPDLSLMKLSEFFEMNPRYLSKLFKEEFSEKFIDYMLKVRLEEASRLLLETDLPVQYIAERVGYQHAISFHRAFKNMFGLPPGDYRRKTDTVRSTVD